MKTKIKRHYRSVISILLSVCMLVSCMAVGLIGTDAANVDSERVGDYSYYRIKSDMSGSWQFDNVSLNGTLTKALPANRTYYFEFYANEDKFGAGTSDTKTDTFSYNFSRNNTNALSFTTSIAGNYVFSFGSLTGNNDSITIGVTYPEDPSAHTWSVTGSNTNLFGGDGTNWPINNAANDMTPNNDYTVYTWSKSNVSLDSGDFQYKVVKDHDWGSGSYPEGTGNQTATVASSGVYDVTITYTPAAASNKLTISITPSVPHTLTIDSIADRRYDDD